MKTTKTGVAMDYQTIVKRFQTLKQAEAFQFRLYSKFDSVRPVTIPPFSESGIYSWYAGNPTNH